MSIFGTRPEAIKMMPIVKEMEKYLNEIDSVVVITGQHRQMLDQILKQFDITPDYDLDIMKIGQTLTDITTRILIDLEPIMELERPDIVLVHGDTTTALAGSLAAYYQQIKVGHVEAGLRTGDKYSPFPEEMNRHLIDGISDLHFAPTVMSENNLIKENVSKETIHVTGNTAIDALLYTLKEEYSHPILDRIDDTQKLILLTMHRRENLGQPMYDVFLAVKKLVRDFPDIHIVFPMHKNNQVRKYATELLGHLDRVHLIEPLEVVDFQNLLAKSYLVLTDSGGIQEEAPSLGIPVLVLRDTTERPEGVLAGTLKLAGTQERSVYSAIRELLVDQKQYDYMTKAKNPYGTGDASKQIIEAILNDFM